MPFTTQAAAAILLLSLASCSSSGSMPATPASRPQVATTGWSMEVQTPPEGITPGRPTLLRVTIRRDGVIQTSFEPVGGAPLHLSVVSRDLQEFHDLHPELDTASGEFHAFVTVVEPRTYILLVDVQPRDEPPASIRGELRAGTAEDRAPDLRVDDGPQRSGSFIITPEVASPLVAGVDLVLISSVTTPDAASLPAQNLRRDAAHVVILRANDLYRVPSSAVEKGGHGGMLSLDNKQVAFGTMISRPGRYVVFTAIPIDELVLIARNVYDVVAPPDGAVVPEATHTMEDGSMMEGEMRSVPVEAFQWGYEPSTIRVSRGTHIRLLLTSRDVPHSFTLSGYEVSETIIPGKTRTLEFVADRAGTFTFGCDVACGSGHADMERAGGILIVE